MSVPRYCSKPFPSYRFLPGVNSHPFESPQGHSYGKFESVVVPLTVTNWFKNETYLYGVDLYNHQYWWESHEAWESLWRRTDDEELTRDFLQGLIKISAAFLKWQKGTPRGVQVHYQGALVHLKNVASRQSIYMGVNLSSFINQLKQSFHPLAKLPVAQWPDFPKNHPAIRLCKTSSFCCEI